MNNNNQTTYMHYNCLICKKSFASQRALSVHMAKSTFCMDNKINNNLLTKNNPPNNQYLSKGYNHSINKAQIINEIANLTKIKPQMKTEHNNTSKIDNTVTASSNHQVTNESNNLKVVLSVKNYP